MSDADTTWTIRRVANGWVVDGPTDMGEAMTTVWQDQPEDLHGHESLAECLTDTFDAWMASHNAAGLSIDVTK